LDACNDSTADAAHQDIHRDNISFIIYHADILKHLALVLSQVGAEMATAPVLIWKIFYGAHHQQTQLVASHV
jgi:hypothetical protein